MPGRIDKDRSQLEQAAWVCRQIFWERMVMGIRQGCHRQGSDIDNGHLFR